MRIRVLYGTTIAGFLALGLVACQDEATGPDTLAPDTELYARGEPGPGGGGGGGGEPPADKKKGDLYADLVYLYRNVNGLPLMKSFTVIDPETLEPTTYHCVQPVSFVPIPDLSDLHDIVVPPTTNPVDGATVYLVPLAGDFMEAAATETAAVGILAEEETTELAPCDPYGEFNLDGTPVFTYGDYADEVPFGRLNLGRSPDRVLDQALREADLKLDAWYRGGWLRHDHAGRFMNADPTLLEESTIDAPAENLALHRQLQLAGYDWHPWLPVHPGAMGPTSFLENAASGIGAAADKGGKVSADMIVYNNRILDIPKLTSVLPKLSPIPGVAGEEGQLYVDYRGFTYNRGATFPGCLFGYQYSESGAITPVSGTIMHLVFGDEAFSGSNIHAFATRADDARAVIEYAHDNAVLFISPIGTTDFCGMTWPPEV